MKACFIGRKSVSKIFSAWPAATACVSLGPTLPMGGNVNTPLATCAQFMVLGPLPNSVSATARPSAMATGVRFLRLVMSPMA